MFTAKVLNKKSAPRFIKVKGNGKLKFTKLALLLLKIECFVMNRRDALKNVGIIAVIVLAE